MAGEDPKHLARLRELPCCKCGRAPPSVPHHHTGRRGFGQKAHDRDAMPLCHACHEDFHAHAGYFRGWDRATKRRWQDNMADYFARLPETPR